MTDTARRLGTVLAIAIGILVGGVAALSADLLTGLPERDTAPAPERSQRPITGLRPEVFDRPQAALVWAPGGLPKVAIRRIRGSEHVKGAAVVIAGLERLTSVTGPEGSPIEVTRPGWFVPLDVAVIVPRSYATFVAPEETRIVATLGRNEVLLSETSAELRDATVGTTITFEDDRSFTVAGIISDRSAGGYEVLVRGPWVFDKGYPFMLASVGDLKAEGRIGEIARDAVRAGSAVRIRSLGETPYLRYGDAVLPLAIIKRNFGEFSMRATSSGFEIDRQWRARNIVGAEVPIIGEVTCHKSLIPQLRAALDEIERHGLTPGIDPADYGGCFSPRFIGGGSTGRLSHHSWGIAVDIDVSENSFGTKPDQDRRIVEIMERHGFTWGGRWLIPDGMHFEWNRFPPLS